MKSFEVLHPDTQILQNYFLEASAGTGKTFAIEHIVPRILLESKDPSISLEEILVVTFTRAAARELKVRIYQNLLKIQSACQTKEGGPPYLHKIRNLPNEEVYQAERKVEEAIYFFEKAQIYTLHGFCLQILQKFAFETHFFLSDKDEMHCSDTQGIKRYIKDFLRLSITNDLLSPSQLRNVLQKAEHDIEKLADKILQRLEGGQKNSSYPRALEQWQEWNRTLAALGNFSRQDLWHDVLIVSPRLFLSDARKEQTERFFSSIEKKYISFEDWDCLVDEETLFLEEISFDRVYKKKTAKELGLRNIGLFEQLQKMFVPLHKRANDASVQLLILAVAAEPYYRQGKEELSHYTPDDLVLNLQKSLQENPSLRAKIRQSYKAVIIDEFQDTDPTQWSIFESLFFNEDSKYPYMYLVGDPKQSIYGFRRADVYLYLKAAALLGDKAIAHLDTNFRSHPDLVDALNTFFSWNMPAAWLPLPRLEKNLEVRKVHSKPKYTSSLDGTSRLDFFLIEQEESRSKKWPSRQIEEERIFPFVAEEIIKLRNLKGFSLKQMAILVKDRYQADRIQKFLGRYNIPCLMQKTFSVKTSTSYEIMKDLLEAAQNPSNMSALKRALGGTLFSYSSQEMEDDSFLIHKAKRLFIEAGQTLQTKGFGVFFQDLLCAPSKESGKNVGEYLLSLEQASLYFELRQLVSLLLQHCPQGLYNPATLIAFLEQMSDLPPDSDILQEMIEEGEDQIEVMTLHKSKGLEFSIVFAIGLCSRHTATQEFLLVHKGQEKEVAAVSQEEEEVKLYQQELDAEKLRQLYVALTRGKEKVYVPCIVSSNSRSLDRGTASPIELFLGAIGLSTYHFDVVYANIEALSLQKLEEYFIELKKQAPISYHVLSRPLNPTLLEEKKDLLLTPPSLIPMEYPKQFLQSFSSLIEGKKESLPAYYPLFSEQEIPLGAETGTIVHAILEELCKAVLHRGDRNSIDLVVRKYAKGSILEGKEDIMTSWIQKVVKTPLCEGLVLEEIPLQDMQTEVEFLYLAEGSLLKGFIDLIFRYRGRYYIVDWKTNYLGPKEDDYTPKQIEICMEENGYFLQAAIYREALQKYLALFDKRPFSSIFGGVVYFFLRGYVPYFFDPRKIDVSLKDVLCNKQ